MSTSVLISTFHPFPTLSVSVPSQTPISELWDIVGEKYPELPMHELRLSSSHSFNLNGPFVSLRLTPRLLGGKGGFGSQLRAAGGRMSSQKTSNNDSCRDLSGRRLSTIKEAKKLAEYLEAEPARKKAASEAAKAKLEALERKLGIQGVDVGPSAASSSGTAQKDDSVVAGKKHRFDDTEYLEQSRELVEGVKSAVSVAMLKKKKKAKLNHIELVPAKDDKRVALAVAQDAPAAVAVSTGA